MRKDKILADSKNYLISVHDTLRRAFRGAPLEETVFIDAVLTSIEDDVKQIETLEEVLSVQKKINDKKMEPIEE